MNNLLPEDLFRLMSLFQNSQESPPDHPQLWQTVKHIQKKADNGYDETSEEPGIIQGLIISYKL